MPKKINAWLGGWILRPHPAGTTPLSVPSTIEGTTPLIDCMEDPAKCDTFALALYVKYVGAHLSLVIKTPVYAEIMGYEVKEARKTLIAYVAQSALGKYASELKGEGDVADKIYEMFAHVLDSNKVDTIDIQASAAKFSKLFEVMWRKVVQNREDVLAKFGPNLWIFCTRVRAYGSYPMAEVYGWTPVVEGDGKMAEVYKWYPVCVPLRLRLTEEEARALGILLDPATKEMPMYPPSNIPGVTGDVRWEDVESASDPVEALRKHLTLAFPYFWTYYSKIYPFVFTTITVDCPYVPHWALWYEKGKLVVESGVPGVHKSYLALGKLVAEKCRGADYATGRISAGAKAVVASQYTVLFPHVLTRLINGPLINVFYWRLMYDIESGHGGSPISVEKVIDSFAREMALLDGSMLSDLANKRVPIYNIINMYTLLSGPMLMGKITVQDNTEKRETHEMYTLVLPSPNWALVGASIRNVKQLYDTRSEYFMPVFLPTVITFGRENVHLDTFPYTTPRNGTLEVLKPFESENEFYRFAEHIYCRRAHGTTCEDPDTILKENGGRLAVDQNLVEGKHPDAQRYFVKMERFWWMFIDSALEMLEKSGLKTLAELYATVLTHSYVRHSYSPPRLVDIAQSNLDVMIYELAFKDSLIHTAIKEALSK